MRKLATYILLAALALSCSKNHGDIKILESEQRDGYTCHLIEYPVNEDIVSAYLLEPDGAGKRPALVLLHDHGARFDIGKEKLVRPVECAPENIKMSSEQWIQANFDGTWLGDRLAKEGYVVIVPDALYWGGRSSKACQRWSRAMFGADTLSKDSLKALKKEVYDGQRAVYDSLLARGIVWAQKTLEEDAAAAKVLAGLESVDKERIGAFGWSMGAHRTWLLTAYSEDIKTGCALSWMTLKSLQKQPYSASEYSMLIPELREKYDFPDIASFLSPKPFYFLSGTSDKLFPAPAVDSCYTRMHELYQGDGLKTEFFDGGHHCGEDIQKRILEWFRDAL